MKKIVSSIVLASVVTFVCLVTDFYQLSSIYFEFYLCSDTSVDKTIPGRLMIHSDLAKAETFELDLLKSTICK